MKTYYGTPSRDSNNNPPTLLQCPFVQNRDDSLPVLAVEFRGTSSPRRLSPRTPPARAPASAEVDSLAGAAAPASEVVALRPRTPPTSSRLPQCIVNQRSLYNDTKFSSSLYRSQYLNGWCRQGVELN